MSIPNPRKRLSLIDHHSKDNTDTHVVMLETHYTNPISEVWDAVTLPDRLADWFGEVQGQLRSGGEFSIPSRGVTGTVAYCDRHRAIILEWKQGERISKVALAVTTGLNGTSVTVRHTLPDDERWGTYGPAEAGIAWDDALIALDVHLAGNIGHTREILEEIHGEQGNDAIPGEIQAAWEQEDVKAGADQETAKRRAEAAGALYA